MIRLHLATAPMVQINTPYPATAYLMGFLQSNFPTVSASQSDPAIELVEKLFCPVGLDRIKKALPKKKLGSELSFFLESFDDYKTNILPALDLLKNRASPEFQKSVARRKILPEGPSFLPLLQGGPLLDQFQSLSFRDRSTYLASLFLDDIALYIQLGVDSLFQFSRYGEKLAASNPDFNILLEQLERPKTLIDEMLEEITNHTIHKHNITHLGLSVPFAGTVYSAFRMGKLAKAKNIPVILGGGYVNTELRSLTDPRVFNYVDFITLDDGEMPLTSLLEFFQKSREKEQLFRTYYLNNNSVTLAKGKSTDREIPFRSTGTPTYKGLDPSKYIGMRESLNPVTQLWSGQYWNKLTLAHGCYWHKCSFCDTHLDYIGRYEAEEAVNLVDRMQKIAEETGVNDFHFVDEAAPPALIKTVSKEILKRKLAFSWWGNIRFDKAFNKELVVLMKNAGCIAVTGGLEVASPRLLSLIQKGVTLTQVAQVTKTFADAGVLVHAYLMYGFPSQTTQETIDSLEVVRQLFKHNCLKSAFWHRFAATVHSPVGRNPNQYGITIVRPTTPTNGLFSENDLPFIDSVKTDHDTLGVGLKTALYNYMHGIGLDEDIRAWFTIDTPSTTVSPTLILDAMPK